MNTITALQVPVTCAINLSHITLFNHAINCTNYQCCVSTVFIDTDATALRLAPFGQATGPIWLDNLACLGFEDSLFNCTYDSHTADCTHVEDAGLRCKRKSSPIL